MRNNAQECSLEHSFDVFTFKLPDGEGWDEVVEIKRALRTIKENSCVGYCQQVIEGSSRHQLKKYRLSALEKLSPGLARSHSKSKAYHPFSSPCHYGLTKTSSAKPVAPLISSDLHDLYAGFMEFGKQQAQFWVEGQEHEAERGKEQMKQAMREMLQEQQATLAPEQEAAPQQADDASTQSTSAIPTEDRPVKKRVLLAELMVEFGPLGYTPEQLRRLLDRPQEYEEMKDCKVRNGVFWANATRSGISDILPADSVIAGHTKRKSVPLSRAA